MEKKDISKEGSEPDGSYPDMAAPTQSGEPDTNKVIVDPIGGDWNWAKEQIELGYQVRRSCWVNKTIVVYVEVDTLVIENLSIDGTIKSYIPLLVDEEATDWELYI